MNFVTYYLLNTINKTRILNKTDLETMWQYYEYGSQKCNYEINIHQNEFEKIFTIIYDILGLSITDEEFKVVAHHYLALLMMDAVDGHYVDFNWFISHVWYLCVGIQKEMDINIYKDCIPFLQQKLIKEFQIEETIKEKVSRKVYTKFMIP